MMIEGLVRVSSPIFITKFDDDAVEMLQTELDKRTPLGEVEPIVLYINSYGGQIYSLMAMLSLLDSVPNPIITVCIGKAMSCGAILLAYGDIRYCSSHGTVMVHEASSGVGGNIHDLRVDIEETTRLNSVLMGILAKKTKIKGGVNAIKKLFSNEKRDVYLSPEAALEMGLVDKIGIPRISAAITISVESE